MFIASKLLSFATQPLAWVALILFAGLLLMSLRRRWGLTLCWLALVALLFQGWQPIPDALLRQLESKHPAVAKNGSLLAYAGVIVLGGALEPAYAWANQGQPALNDAAERMTATVALAQRFPNLKVVFTGGEGELLGKGLTEADRAKIFFDSMGLPIGRVQYESNSHTTYENAVLTAALPDVDKNQPWLLLTSANHMPRAMATFIQAGWNVTAYPVDFRTGTATPWSQYSLQKGAHKWHLALHEMLGLLAYRLAGRA